MSKGSGPVADQTIRFTVSLPEELLAALDRRVQTRGYESRSGLVRDLIREKLVEDRWQDEGKDVVGVLTISYDHHQRDLTHKIMEIQHNQYVHILCSTHVHLDHHNCLEVLVLKGPGQEVRALAERLIATKGIMFGKLSLATTGADLC